MNIQDSIHHFSKALSDVSEDALLETRPILQKAAGLSRSAVLSHPERELTKNELKEITDMVSLRSTGYPLPYILGKWEFYGNAFIVNPTVLIPRPETELLVEEACAWLKQHPEIHTGYDIGTGSGCIAISLLLENKTLRMTAVDLHRSALCTAISNAERHQVQDRFFPVQSSLFSSFSDGAQLICANLPYIPSETCKTIEPARFEPLSALDGGDDGFKLYRLLFQQLSNKMKREYLILCEIEYRQRALALETAAAFFPDAEISVREDLAGQPRLLKIKN